MQSRHQQPWHSPAGTPRGPQWPINIIMDKTYAAARLLARPRSKADFCSHLRIARHTYLRYLSAVGMFWYPNQGPPPEDHLVMVVTCSDHVLQWVSASVSAAVGVPRDELIGQDIRLALRRGRQQQVHYDRFAQIIQALRAGLLEPPIGECETYLLQHDGRRLPLHLRVTYGQEFDCVFIDATAGRPEEDGSPTADTFNVVPNLVLRQGVTPDQVEVLDMDGLLRLYRESLPPYSFQGGDGTVHD